MRRNNRTFWQAVKWWGWCWLGLVPLAALGMAPMGAVTRSPTVWGVLFVATLALAATLPMFD